MITKVYHPLEYWVAYISATLQNVRLFLYESVYNLCAAELFVSISHSFEAGIPDANISFKCRNNNIFHEKWISSKRNYLINWASTERYVANFSGILFSLHLLKTVYLRLYAQLDQPQKFRFEVNAAEVYDLL